MFCAACPDSKASPSSHCYGCNQHLWPSQRTDIPTTYAGVQCKTECNYTVEGVHTPFTKEPNNANT